MEELAGKHDDATRCKPQQKIFSKQSSRAQSKIDTESKNDGKDAILGGALDLFTLVWKGSETRDEWWTTRIGSFYASCFQG